LLGRVVLGDETSESKSNEEDERGNSRWANEFKEIRVGCRLVV
jgi:hypothetical protein